MDHTQREIRNEIEATRVGMVEKIATLESRVDHSIREVKRSFDIRYQTERRPWLMVGMAAAAGYLFSGLILGRPAPRARVILPKEWGARSGASQNAGITQSLAGILSGVVTATAVSLARDYASKLIFKREQKANGHDPDTADPNRRYQ